MQLFQGRARHTSTVPQNTIYELAQCQAHLTGFECIENSVLDHEPQPLPAATLVLPQVAACVCILGIRTHLQHNGSARKHFRGDKKQIESYVQKMQASMVQTSDEDGCDMISHNTRCSNFTREQKPTEACLV